MPSAAGTASPADLKTMSGPTAEWTAAQKQVRISVDLIPIAQQQQQFLAAVSTWHAGLAVASPDGDDAGLLHTATRNAIRRYEECWLPMLNEMQTNSAAAAAASDTASTASTSDIMSVGGTSAATSDTDCDSPMLGLGSGLVIPPLDVHWIWYCHRLAPEAYESDCKALFGRVVDCPPQLLSLRNSAVPCPLPAASGNSPSSSQPESSSGTPRANAMSPGHILAHGPPARTASMDGGSGARGGGAGGSGPLLARELGRNSSVGSRSNGSSGVLESVGGGGLSGGALGGAATQWALQQSRRRWAIRWPSEPYDPHVLPPLTSLLTLPELHSFREAGLDNRMAGGMKGFDVEAAADAAEGFAAVAGSRSAATTSGRSKIQYDLYAAARRHAAFIHQVLRPHMSNEKYLFGSIERYRAFLHLARATRQQQTTLVPPIDVDVVWHCHQLCTKEYRDDCAALFGGIFGHDDAVHHGGPSSGNSGTAGVSTGIATASAAHADATAKMWEETFGIPYVRAGALYRGRAPAPVKIPKPPSKGGKGSPKGGGSGTASGARSAGSPSSGKGSPGNSPASSPMQDSKPGAKLGIPPRNLAEVYLGIAGVAGVGGSAKGEVYVKITPLRSCSGVQLRSARVPVGSAGLVPLRSSWHVHADTDTQGVLIEVCLVASGMLKSMKSDKVLGEAKIVWSDVFSQPGLADCRLLPSSKGPVSLGLRLSVTPPCVGFNLLALLPSGGTDDSGYQLSSAYQSATKQPQLGRWQAFVAVDHTQAERLLLRIRVGKGSGSAIEEVTADAKRVVLHRGGWGSGPKAKGVPFAAGERVEELWQMKSKNMESSRTWSSGSGWSVQWMALTGWRLQVCFGPIAGGGGSGGTSPVTRSPAHSAGTSPTTAIAAGAITEQHLTFFLTKFPGAYPAALLPGKRLEYEPAWPQQQDGSSDSNSAPDRGEGDGYMTLVRFPPDLPQGRATALINWKTGAFEIAPEERTEVVVMLAVAVAESWVDMSPSFKKKTGMMSMSKAIKRAPLAQDDVWGAVSSASDSPVEERRQRGGGSGTAWEGAPLQWYDSPTLMWNSTQLYSASDVPGSAALTQTFGAGLSAL